MLEKVMVHQAAPTMAGIKVANLYPYAMEKGENLENQLEEWNRAFSAKGIRTIAIGKCSACTSRVLLYSYRPSKLNEILQREDVRCFLMQYGYERSFTAEECIELLSTRLCPKKEFPHEIGVFLGYPLHDVIGFIENNGKGYLSSGLWKVYAEKEKAEKQFRLFKHCTQIYCKCYAGGRTLNQLIVAV